MLMFINIVIGISIFICGYMAGALNELKRQDLDEEDDEDG